MAAVDLRFFIPVETFEKAGTKERRIGGIVTTEAIDRDDEQVLLDGLDFSQFERTGCFNDNHGKSVTDVLGFPDRPVQILKKGEPMPDGRKAPVRGIWAEGFLVGRKGEEVWDLARSLVGTGRQLGFSVEGKVVERDPIDPTRVTKALVKNIAVTHCPVNPEVELVTLVKAMGVGGSIVNPGPAAGEGFPLRTESLEGATRSTTFGGGKQKRKRKRKKGKKEGLTEEEGTAFLRSCYPKLSDEQAKRAYRFAARAKAARLI